MLTRLLGHRFGVLPDAVRGSIAAADLPALVRWGTRLFDTASIEGVPR